MFNLSAAIAGAAPLKRPMIALKRHRLMLIDQALLNLIFMALHYWSQGTLRLPPSYSKLLLLMNAAWLVISLSNHKFTLKGLTGFGDILLMLGRTALLMLFATSLTLVIWDLRDFARLHILGTFSLLLLAEILIAGMIYPNLRQRIAASAITSRRRTARQSIPFALTDLLLFILFFTAVHQLKYGTAELDSRSSMMLGIMAGMWLLSAEWTGKFIKHPHPNFYYLFEPFIKAAFIMTASAAVLIWAFQLFAYSRTLLLAPVLLLLAAEAPLALVWLRIRSVKAEERDVEDAAAVSLLLEEKELPLAPAGELKEAARHRLENHFLAEHPAIFRLLDSRCDLDAVELSAVSVLDTHTSFNIEILEPLSRQLFVNLHRVNDFRYLNRYFLTVHQKLVQGGYFAGLMDTYEGRYNSLNRKYPKYMAQLIYLLDFLVRRVMPKLPVLEKVYFTFSRGRSRALSNAELLGRLYFCGFRVLAALPIGTQLLYIAQKDKSPSDNPNPSYGPLVKLKRIGYQGQPFTLYKLRTMHPYSEFIQDYVHKHNDLDESGKFKDDFRVTTWGRLFRKFWLDELPQLINWLRGDVKIVGARALSEHYYSLYPKELQKLRNRFKPGLVPPFYVDLPKSLKEVQASERRYFEAKLAHPIKTDWIYFFKAMHNILIKKARSK